MLPITFSSFPGTDVEQPNDGGDVHNLALVGACPNDSGGATATRHVDQQG